MRKFIFALIALCGLASVSQACDRVFSFRGGCIPSQSLAIVQQPVLTYQPVLVQQQTLIQQDVYSFRSFGGCNSGISTFGIGVYGTVGGFNDFGSRVRVRAPGVRVIVR